MFRLGASAMTGRTPLEGFDHVARNVSDQQLGHGL